MSWLSDAIDTPWLGKLISPTLPGGVFGRLGVFGAAPGAPLSAYAMSRLHPKSELPGDGPMPKVDYTYNSPANQSLNDMIQTILKQRYGWYNPQQSQQSQFARPNLSNALQSAMNMYGVRPPNAY